MGFTGRRIKTLREKQRLTQKQFGERIGVTSATVSAWEKSERSPSAQHIKKICNAFKVNPNYLLKTPVAAGSTEEEEVQIYIEQLKENLNEKQIVSLAKLIINEYV